MITVHQLSKVCRVLLQGNKHYYGILYSFKQRRTMSDLLGPHFKKIRKN